MILKAQKRAGTFGEGIIALSSNAGKQKVKQEPVDKTKHEEQLCLTIAHFHENEPTSLRKAWTCSRGQSLRPQIPTTILHILTLPHLGQHVNSLGHSNHSRYRTFRS